MTEGKTHKIFGLGVFLPFEWISQIHSWILMEFPGTDINDYYKFGADPQTNLDLRRLLGLEGDVCSPCALEVVFSTSSEI